MASDIKNMDDLQKVLIAYGFTSPCAVKQIDNKSVWQINDNYILKQHEDENEVKKSLAVNKFLREESISVCEYIKAATDEYYIIIGGYIYNLMRRMNGV